MTQPPYDPDAGRPQDAPRSFPNYGRPDQPHAQQPATPWAAPGQPQPQQPPPPYGQPQPQPTQPPYGHAGGQTPYGQPGGQAPYGQPQYGQPQYPAAYGPAPAPYGYGYGYPGTTGGTNGLATAALATGIGGIFFGLAAPVAIGLGIAALVQLKKRQETGKGMAIAGLVIGSLTIIGYLVLFGVLIAIGSTVDDTSSAPEPVSSAPADITYVEYLAVGDCYDDGEDENEAIRKPCAEPHDAEIIADVTLPDGPYPGDKGVRKAADNTCATEFGTYVGTPADESELEFVYWSPDESLWNHNDRLVVCAAYGPDDEPLTGSVKGTHR
ncbi:DUF4190 domain-containing protein [Kribbella sp. NBC_01484]|uniref:DUF4190 domain-containing protein n=1 Tax=Kribbella sp. NBC_01484 TaxID=2903579 RepID=UPI002E362E50|nr:DUF4190 domain-containing protein [Kribbella sp. NBC_01484]